MIISHPTKITNKKSNQAKLYARSCVFLLRCGEPLRVADVLSLSTILPLIMINYQTCPTFWLTDVKPQTARPLQNVNNLTLCSSQGWRLDPSNDSAAKLIPTPTEWLMAFPEPQCILSLARLCEGACVCGCVFVWDCRGDNQQWQRGLSCPCCCAARSCPGQGLPVGPFQLLRPPTQTTTTPPHRPLSPPLLLFPLKLHSVALLFPFEEAVLWFPHLLTLERRVCVCAGKSCKGV